MQNFIYVVRKSSRLLSQTRLVLVEKESNMFTSLTAYIRKRSTKNEYDSASVINVRIPPKKQPKNTWLRLGTR